jgi:hypothetical protein
MSSISILAVVISRIPSLDVLTVDGLGYHILPTSFPAIIFMGYLKDGVNSKNPRRAVELKEETASVFIRITADTVRRAVASFQHLLQMIFDACGSHTEYVSH